MPHAMSFASMLAAGRARLGLTRVGLADRVGTTVHIVAAFEQGDAIPTTELLRAIAGGLGWSEADIEPFVDRPDELLPPVDWAALEAIGVLVADSHARLETLYRSGQAGDDELGQMQAIRHSVFDLLWVAVGRHWTRTSVWREQCDETGYSAFAQDLTVLTGFRVDK